MVDRDTRLPDVIGGRTSTALERTFGLRTVGDLLSHYPRRLTDRGELTDLGSLQVGDDVTVLARVRSAQVLPYRTSTGDKQERLQVVVSDGKGTLELIFFRQTWRKRDLMPGRLGLFAGKVTVFRQTRQLTHPEYQLLAEDGFEHLEASYYAESLIPVYPATKDVRSWTIKEAVALCLEALDPIPDPLPPQVRAWHGLLDLDTAVRAVHEPDTRPQWWAARHRLKWDEALGVQLALAQRRIAASARPAVPRPGRSDGLLAAFDERLPFRLTEGQVAVGTELAAELAGAHPMHRLLQGEVGSGKTVVALRAMLQVVDSGGQAALLAPTEVLASQHARTIEAMLGSLAQAGRLGGGDRATRVALLTGSLPASARRTALLAAARGAAGIVVGTHALIQEHVSFADLGLVVVDEQHRFGVEQRDALRGKASQPPHLLVMTATPIPRTVAMTVFGDLDTSTLRELPAGRSPVTTTVVPTAEQPAWLARVWQRVREEVAAGRQAYVVCPRIAPLHGRLAPEVKDATMAAFIAGELEVLVATTVIEVGVDVPNATVIAVLDASRFGVSQLHQLRGRVGRGRAPGICLLVTDAEVGSAARDRVEAVAATTDGFELARLDLEQRREGDVLGVAQSGRRSQLRLLSLRHDEELIAQARDEAAQLIEGDPDLLDHPLLAIQVAELIADGQAEYLEKA